MFGAADLYPPCFYLSIIAKVTHMDFQSRKFPSLRYVSVDFIDSETGEVLKSSSKEIPMCLEKVYSQYFKTFIKEYFTHLKKRNLSLLLSVRDLQAKELDLF